MIFSGSPAYYRWKIHDQPVERIPPDVIAQRHSFVKRTGYALRHRQLYDFGLRNAGLFHDRDTGIGDILGQPHLDCNRILRPGDHDLVGETLPQQLGNLKRTCSDVAVQHENDIGRLQPILDDQKVSDSSQNLNSQQEQYAEDRGQNNQRR